MNPVLDQYLLELDKEEAVYFNFPYEDYLIEDEETRIGTVHKEHALSSVPRRQYTRAAWSSGIL